MSDTNPCHKVKRFSSSITNSVLIWCMFSTTCLAQGLTTLPEPGEPGYQPPPKSDYGVG